MLVDFIMCSVLLGYRTNSFLVFNNPCITRWKINNNRKRHFHFYSHASKDQMFTLLDAAKSNNEDEIDELINDLDMEFIAPGDMKLTDNSGNVSNLTLEANALVVDQGNTRTKELEKKKPEESIPIIRKCNVSPHSQEKRVELFANLTQVLQVSIFMKKFLILMF